MPPHLNPALSEGAAAASVLRHIKRGYILISFTCAPESGGELAAHVLNCLASIRADGFDTKQARARHVDLAMVRGGKRFEAGDMRMACSLQVEALLETERRQYEELLQEQPPCQCHDPA